VTLRAEGVTVRIGARTLLERVSVALEPGALLALGGRNGAGKSTLLSVMAGLRRPSEGEVLLDGRSVHLFEARALARRRAVLPQRDRLDQPLLAREVVALGRYPHGKVDPRAPQVERALQQVSALGLADRPVDQLSGGERQRVQLARVLAQLDAPGPPGLLLLDEPTSALDLASQHQVLRLLWEASRRGLAVLCVLHDLNLASCWADRLVLLSEGQVAADGPPSEVMTPEVLWETLGVRAHVLVHPDHGRPQVVVAEGQSGPGST
jgi:iron complex transport system ATP-binding protein